MNSYSKCKTCIHFIEDGVYKGDGMCDISGNFTREHRVCMHKPSAHKSKRSTNLISIKGL